MLQYAFFYPCFETISLFAFLFQIGYHQHTFVYLSLPIMLVNSQFLLVQFVPENVKPTLNNITKYSTYESEETCFIIKGNMKAYFINELCGF